MFNLLPEEPDDLDKLMNEDEGEVTPVNESEPSSTVKEDTKESDEPKDETFESHDVDDTAEQEEEDPMKDVILGIDEEDTRKTKQVLADTLEEADDETTFRKKIKKLVDEGVISVYEDKEDIEEYTHDELVKLIKDNIEEVNKKAQEQAILSLLDTLPEEVQYVIEYALRDGKDFKKVFKLLAEYDETKDITSALDDEDVLMLYYKETKGMDEEEIESLIESYKRKGIFNSKVSQARKELTEIRKSKIQEEIKKQEVEAEERRKGFEQFKNNLISSIEKSNLFKTDKTKKLKDEFVSSLLEIKYDSISGQKTNKFNHLLEKYLYVEPNYDLIAEVYWLMSNPQSYKEFIRSDVKQKVIKEEVIPKLKKKSQELSTSSTENIDYSTDEIKKVRKHEVNRNKRKFFDF
jgi:hypothetical protein